MKEQPIGKNLQQSTIVYRYVRPLCFAAERNEVTHSVTGGISFRFDIDHSLNITRFCFVRCANDVKFDWYSAKKQLQTKIKTGQTYLIIVPDKSLSLVQNVEVFCKNSTQIELNQLRKHLNQINTHNLQVNQDAYTFYSKVTEKVKVQYELT